MRVGRNASVLRNLDRLFLRGVVPAGMRLLERFLAEGDDSAFEALVVRHGPMVLGVCQRIRISPHDADDAFQATFLVLARKAARLSPPSARPLALRGRNTRGQEGQDAGCPPPARGIDRLPRPRAAGGRVVGCDADPRRRVGAAAVQTPRRPCPMPARGCLGRGSGPPTWLPGRDGEEPSGPRPQSLRDRLIGRGISPSRPGCAIGERGSLGLSLSP